MALWKVAKNILGDTAGIKASMRDFKLTVVKF